METNADLIESFIKNTPQNDVVKLLVQHYANGNFSGETFKDLRNEIEMLIAYNDDETIEILRQDVQLKLQEAKKRGLSYSQIERDLNFPDRYFRKYLSNYKGEYCFKIPDSDLNGLSVYLDDFLEKDEGFTKHIEAKNPTSLIKIARLKKRLKSEDVAKLIGVSANVYQAIESGITRINNEIAHKLSQILDIEIQPQVFISNEGIRNEIRNARKQKGLSQKELGDKVGYSQVGINKVETFGTYIETDLIEKLEEILDVKIG